MTEELLRIRSCGSGSGKAGSRPKHKDFVVCVGHAEHFQEHPLTEELHQVLQAAI